jgi:hypothetical protein
MDQNEITKQIEELSMSKRPIRKKGDKLDHLRQKRVKLVKELEELDGLIDFITHHPSSLNLLD